MSVARVVPAVAVVAAVLAAVAAPVEAQQAPGVGTDSVPEASEQVSAPGMSAPVLGAAFVLEGEWVASGVVWLDWDDIEDATGYELMYRSAHGWVLLADDVASGGVVVAFEGSGARVVGLPPDVAEHWFAVRARNVWGVSAWSDSVGVEVPAYAQTGPAGAVVFDPFTAPTRSGIDLERLREAVATVAPGRADCSMVPTLDVAGILVVDPPATLGDIDAELSVAEVVRVAGGCLVVEYAALAGRTVNEVRELLEAEPSVHAVGAPVRGLSLESHGGDHIDDGGGEQWHLAEDLFKDDLWKNWVAASPVTVAVLDTGVSSTHPDLFGKVATGGLDACHRRDRNGHGTHVAGIVAADNGDGYVAGVAPDAEILSVRVLDQAVCEPEMTATAAVAAAVNAGARVINMSFKWPLCERDTGTVGGVPIKAEDKCDPDMYDPGDADDSFELALRAGSMLGVVAITSVGNDGQDTDKSGPPNQRNGPAVYPEVISVAAINENGRPYSRSTANDLVDMAAPGGGILSTVPLLTCKPAEDTDGDGMDEWGPLGCGTDTSPAECAAGTPLREFREDPPPACAHYVGHKWGTSMASPFVAGVVAHMLNRHPDTNVGDVRLALVRSARRDLEIDFPNHSYGFGIVDPVEAVARLGEIVAGVEAADAGGFAAVAAGGRFSCGLRSSGRVRCWGQSGAVANTPGLAFDEVSAPTGPADHACGINMSSLEPGGPRYGTALCWSATGAGVPRVVQGTLDQVATGFAASCGLRPDKSVVCWDNDTGASRYQSDVDGETFAEISGGWLHFCGRRGDNGVACWGSNAHGQTDVPASVKFLTVDAGGSHTCGVTVAGAVRCWGRAGATAGAPASTRTGFVALDAGHGHTCAIRQAGPGPLFNAHGGSAVCWGDNSHSQTAVPSGSFTQVSAGWRHSCGRRPDATVVCWGSDSSGQAPQARLASLSLTLAGTNLIAFNPDVTDYSIIAEPGQADLAYTVADHETSEPSAEAFPPDANTDPTDSMSAGHQVTLADGAVIEVRVDSLFGFGVSRTYRIHVSGPPRLTSLSVIPEGSGPHCTPACAPLALDPAFNADVHDYRVVAAADVSKVTVSYAHVGGRAVVSPGDADADLSGHQVALSTDRGFVAIATGSSSSCGIKTDASVACWGYNRHGQADAPSGSFTAISSGNEFSCGIKTDASVACWGSNRDGQTSAPSGSFTAIAAGLHHLCGIKTDDTVACWGSNYDDQADAPSGSFAAIAAGAGYSCGIKTDDTVACWGTYYDGQADAPSGSFTAIAAGLHHLCGIKTDDTVACWGDNYHGQTDAPSGSFTAIAAAARHSCGIKTDDTVACWGDNRYGQTDAPSGSFTAIAAAARHSCGIRADADASVVCWGDYLGQKDAPSGSYSAIAAGSGHSCGIKTDASVACWGDNWLGQTDAPSGSFTAIAAGAVHSCGIKTDASVACWGYNLFGRTDAPSGSFTAVAAGAYHSCGIKTDASVACWGDHIYGQTDAPSGSFTGIASGHWYACGIKTDASVACWGYNHYGQTDAPSGSFAAIAAGRPHSCGIKTDASVACWGYNHYGQTDAPSGSFAAIAAGGLHSCGIKTDDTVVCWGDNQDGQTDAPAGSFRSIAAGGDHACGIRTDNSVICWGARSALLEPAAPETVIVEIAGRAGRAASVRYEVTIARPEPAAPVRSSRSPRRPGVSGAGAPDEAPARCQEIADLWQCLGAWPECMRGPAGCPGSQTGGGAGAAGPARPEPGAASGSASPPEESSPPRGDSASAGTTDAATGRSSVVACPNADAATVVTIADDALLAGINRRLDKAPGSAVTAAEMAELTVLELVAGDDGGRVVSVAGLEHAKNLTSLDLHGQDVSDISALSCLGRLTALELGANAVSDISALSTLTGLTTLGLAGNNITDLGDLSALSSLTALDVSHNNITTIAALSGLAGLRSLNVASNQITGLATLSALAGLEALYAYDNQITDLAPLASLTGLKTLYLDHNQITDITALSSLTSLRTLGLGDNRISDIAPLGGLTSLEALYVFDNDITDARALAGLSGLRALWIDGNDLASPYRLPDLGGLDYLDVRHNLISDIAPIGTAAAPEAAVHREPQRVTTIHISNPGLRAALLAASGKGPGEPLDAAEVAAIERLDLQQVPLGGLGELAALASLRWLNLLINGLAGLDDLPALANLDTLFVDFNNISDLSPLSQRTGLRSLGLVGNNITDIAPLRSLRGLESLFLSANNITDLSALAGLQRLHHLRLTTNNIADLEPLAGLAALTQLHLRHNNIADLEPLAKLTGLVFLDLRDNNITSLEPLAGLTRLRNLHIGGNHITDFTPLDHLSSLTIHGRNRQTPAN